MPEMGLEETKQAIEAASKAFKTWSKTSAKVCRLHLSTMTCLPTHAPCSNDTTSS